MAYIVRSDVETYFGAGNVETWADLDNDGVEATISARITTALADAESFVNAYLGGGVYDVPFVTVPTEVKRATALLAGIDLHGSRGIDDTEGEKTPIERRRDEAMALLDMVRTGTLKLSGETRATNAPAVIEDENNGSDRVYLRSAPTS